MVVIRRSRGPGGSLLAWPCAHSSLIKLHCAHTWQLTTRGRPERKLTGALLARGHHCAGCHQPTAACHHAQLLGLGVPVR